MAVTIGADYFAHRKELTDAVREGSVNVIEMEAKNHACYFCVKPITGVMIALVAAEFRDGRAIAETHFFHTACYEHTLKDEEEAPHDGRPVLQFPRRT